jgi:hypothetical protein
MENSSTHRLPEATTCNFPTQLRARLIMRRNIFGVEEAVKYLGVSPSEDELAIFSEIPFSEWELAERKDTHILVAVFPLSVAQVRDLSNPELFLKHKNESWIRERFAENPAPAGWYLLRRGPVPCSTGKPWDVQQMLLGPNEAVPQASVVTYALVGHYLATGEMFIDGLTVRCRDICTNGNQVRVGYGVRDPRGEEIGLASMYVAASMRSWKSHHIPPSTTLTRSS